MNARPAVYGLSSQLAVLLDNVAGFVDREPDHSFRDDEELRTAATHLKRMLAIRLKETTPTNDKASSEDE